MHIRGASVEDCHGIAQAHVSAWQSAYAGIMPAEFLSSLSIVKRAVMWREIVTKGTAKLFIAVEHEVIIGFTAVGNSRDIGAPSDHHEVWAINLRENAWGRGVGKELIDSAVGFAVERAAARLNLWVLTANNRARAFYSKCGFELVEGMEKTIEVDGVRIQEVQYSRNLSG